MKAGDLVRFKPPHFIRQADGVFGSLSLTKNFLGLLVEYNTWEKVATIMYEGEIVRVPARDVEKFGKRGLNV